MTSASPHPQSISIRPLQGRDFDALEHLASKELAAEHSYHPTGPHPTMEQMRPWYGVLKCLSWVPNPLQHMLCAFVAEHAGQPHGMIRVSPVNRTRSTWRVEQIAAESTLVDGQVKLLATDVASQLLRYCLQNIWEARTWMIEVDVNDSAALGVYRQTGFQPLAQMAYWAIAPDLLTTLAQREPDLPNLLPVSNADAFLLHQLDTVAMPPLVRQVFDRQPPDFKSGVFQTLVNGVQHWVRRVDSVSGYVFEPQRKAAIGYFNLQLCRDGRCPHVAELTVHPAYTWLYPELLAQMARMTQDCPPQQLCLASADYQSEREEYLAQIGAERTQHTLLMSRSVWHKLRETRPVSFEYLPLPEVLQGLQPARKPVPSRFSMFGRTAANPMPASHPIPPVSGTVRDDHGDSAPASPETSNTDGKSSDRRLPFLNHDSMEGSQG
ncbi:MAG: GNAT family N-acetyltransferase [Synechococcales cyanobacterium K44_A2020_017]|nr:GNAT family N-acetyltransferase [Synechococcales cyanobacterium K32_A2020_035]MBF2094569.1 GNAT family N-acetyltransferase [Synechococcales cyanobacterium K44_A2020_017]